MTATRAGIISRLEMHARTARKCAMEGKPMHGIDMDLFFAALADAGRYNRLHPDDLIAPLDPVTCKVGGRSDTNLHQELGAPVRVA